MSNNKIPFYTQGAILDSYIKKPQSKIDTGIIEAIIEMLQKNSELRAYFFRTRPHPDWAKILWDNGFFIEPPKAKEDDRFLPHWDVQNFLISVADKVPEIVINHVNVLNRDETREWYLSQAVAALSKLDLEYIEEAIPHLLSFIDSNSVDRVLFDYVYEIMIRFAKAGKKDIAFKLFAELTEPVISEKDKPSNLLSHYRPCAKSDSVLDKRSNRGDLIILEKLDPIQLILILEDHLRTALDLEEKEQENRRHSESSFWRSSIEDTDQNAYLDYKENLLDALRDSIHSQLEKHSQYAIEKVESFLIDEYKIMNRMGIHFVRLFPQIFSKELETILLNPKNLNETDIHHEIFLLLRDSFLYLEESQKSQLIELILAGPPEDYRQWLDRRADDIKAEGLIENEKEWVEMQLRNWGFNRLWMIQDQLLENIKEIFKSLFTEFGEPPHPTYQLYSTGVRQVVQISPVSREELEKLKSTERIEFARNWTPENGMEYWPHERSYVGLGNELANLLFENPDHHHHEIIEIGIIKPDYASAFLNKFSQTEFPSPMLWEIIIDLSSAILSEESHRFREQSLNNDAWINVRLKIARILSSGLRHKDKRIPNKSYQQVKGNLEILVNDPDPDIVRDQPTEGYLGYKDPITLALNSVRPIALNTLITCYMDLYKIANPEHTSELGKSRMDNELRSVFEEKLDPEREPSQAVRSVFGQRLINLMWLDVDWVKENIDRIFPENDDEKSKSLFISAISSFVIQRNYFHKLFPILKSKYEKALDYFSKGFVIKTHLQLIEHFAAHLMWEYLINDYALDENISDSEVLIIKFFKYFDENGRQSGAFIIRRLMDAPANVEKYWLKIRHIWEWRTREAIQSGHTSDFDGELLSFAQLVEVAPESESLKSLWPLLNATVPHLQSLEYRDYGWDAIENYLAEKVDSEPLLAIRLYIKMYDQVEPPRWLTRREEARKIIETAVKHEKSKDVACELINLIGSRLGDDQFKDIFEKYC